MTERNWHFTAPCHFGLEAVLKRELADLGLAVQGAQAGRVHFSGDARALVRANLCLQSAERVLLEVGRFTATSYEELFQGTKALPWEDFLPEHGRFWVKKASTVKSALFSPSDIQRVMKKAMVERMKQHYPREHFPEDGADYPIRVSLLKDEVSVCLDTTGDSLHKRGYRKLEVAAPIAENLAAAILLLSPWRGDRILVDPFCGSGTFPIEAARMAAHIAPGLDRRFTAEQWPELVPAALWQEERASLRAQIRTDIETDIQGYDIDPAAVEVARKNAEAAGVADLIHFQVRPLAALSHRKKYGFIITNPPYGERIGNAGELYGLYRELGERYRALPDWSMYVITGYEDAEKALGGRPDKNRKIYNGMLQTRLYEYRGAKPPKQGNRA
ncbi:MAG: class I SAM-dependent RNA methyltransferase [Butyrivibrio sp.]|nr:class I SAM-dependent RNA methyltransferase [Butyrivibrio sp.]